MEESALPEQVVPTPIASAPQVRTAPAVTGLPSIKILITESWNLLTANLFKIILLYIIQIVVTFAVIIGFGVAVFGYLIMSGLLSSLPNNDPSAFLNLAANQYLTIGVVVFLFILVMTFVNTLYQIAVIRVLGISGEQLSVSKSIRTSFGLVIPFIITNILVSLLLFGSFFVFIIPALLFGFLFSFVSYEVILNGKSYFNAIRRSVLIVTTHFGGIFMRVLVIYAIYLLFFAVTGVLSRIDDSTAVFVAIISFPLNIALTVYGITYVVTLYKHASAGLDDKKGTGLGWILLISIIGILFFGLTVVGTVNLYNTSPLKESVIKALNEARNVGLEKEQPELTAEQNEDSELLKILTDAQATFTAIRNETDPEKVKELSDANITSLLSAVAISQNNAQVWINLGHAYTWSNNIGTFEDALNAYKRAEDLSPTDEMAIIFQGDALGLLKRNDEAVLEYKRALRLNDNSAYGYYRLGTVYHIMKLYTLARENYTKAVELYTADNENGEFDQTILSIEKELGSLPK